MFVDCSRLLCESDFMITPGDVVSDLVNEMQQDMIDLWGDGTDGKGERKAVSEGNASRLLRLGLEMGSCIVSQSYRVVVE